MRQTSQHIQSGASYFHYYIRDHQGNNRVVAKYDGTIEQTTHYYPYGGILSQSTNQGVQKFKYNGKEFDRMHGLDVYDFGARQQDPEVGMFTSMDPMCEKYYNVSPYAYCMGNPIRYVDPDGRAIIFINGNHFGDGGSKLYWKGVDVRIMNTTLDFHSYYYDGSIGGYCNGHSLFSANRISEGYKQGYSDAGKIIKASKGESLKFVTHSMGGAYGKGFVNGMKAWAEDNNKTLPQIEYVFDIAPFDSDELTVPSDLKVNTIQVTHTDDPIAECQKEKGISEDNYHKSYSGNVLNFSTAFGHGIKTFLTDIMKWLPESQIPSFNMNQWEQNPKNK